MFSQATSALERSEGGLGIGLALARGLVQLHGGTIEARSAGAGKGSEFVVTLPPSRRPSGGAGSLGDRGAGAPDPHAALRVLVADDNRDSADSLAMLLRAGGTRCGRPTPGRRRWPSAAEFRPQVALLDIGMPGMNGYEVARQHAGGEPGASGMVLVAVTGWGQEEDKRQAREAGFDHHLAKPVDPDALHHLLATVATRGVDSTAIG